MPAEPPQLSWLSYGNGAGNGDGDGDGDGNGHSNGNGNGSSDGDGEGDGADKDCLGQPHSCSQQQRFPCKPIACVLPLLLPTAHGTRLVRSIWWWFWPGFGES